MTVGMKYCLFIKGDNVRWYVLDLITLHMHVLRVPEFIDPEFLVQT